jgi:hypothetical protein
VNRHHGYERKREAERPRDRVGDTVFGALVRVEPAAIFTNRRAL